MTDQNPKTQKPEKRSGEEIDIGRNVSKSVVINGSGNVVNVREKPSKQVRPKRNAALTIAWIGFAATILAAIITVLGNQTNIPSLDGAAGNESKVTETSTSPLSSTPTVTETLISDTAIPTLTPVPPVEIGKDWIQGCISTLWQAYPSTVQPIDRGDGCWQEPLHAFLAENGDLDFLYERARGESETYGLFALLPESGKVTLTIRLKDLTNADLLIGIFSQPDIYSQGLLMIMLNGGVEKNVFIQKDPLTYATLQGTQKIDQGNGYSITFRFDNLSARSIINPAVFFTDSVSIPSTQKWLFLGYKGLNGYYRIEGTFLNFELAP